jgi:hypothetical protein
VLSDVLAEAEKGIKHYLSGRWENFYDAATKAEAQEVLRVVGALREKLDAPPFANQITPAVVPDPQDHKAVEHTHGQLAPDATDAERATRYRMAQAAKLIRTFMTEPQGRG